MMVGRGTNAALRGHHHQSSQTQPQRKRRSNQGKNKRRKPPVTIYQVIKPNFFADHRPAFADPLSFSRPDRLDLRELKRLALSSRELLNAWHDRFKQGSVETFRNGFIIPDKHRHERQAVFRLKVEDQERLVCNRSRHFWHCLKVNNEYDQRQLRKALDRIWDPDNHTEGAVLPTSNYSEEKFAEAVEARPAWKKAFLRLHHMVKWLKSLIYLHMFSPQFDFRFCELRYEYEPLDSWNPLPVEDGFNKHHSSLYQTEFLFQKLTDFILIADQIQALSRALSVEVHNWHRSRLLPPPSPSGRVVKPIFDSVLHQSSAEMHLAPPGTKLGFMAYDTSREANQSGTSVLRLLTVTESHRAVIQTCLLNPETQQLKKLIARTEIPREVMENDCAYIQRRQKIEEKYASMIVCDKYIVMYEELDIDYEKVKNGKRTPCRIPGPSFTIWDREGKLKEKKDICFKSDIPCHLKRLPGRRFALVAKMVSDGEAKSLIYNLDNNSEPVMYNGEIEDSNSNYFVLRLADHAQFYAFNNKTDKEAEYLFSIRSFQDERIRLCSGGQDRYATSRIALSYHIQVFNFPPRRTTRLNQRSGSPRQTARLGQYEELQDAVEDVTHTPPVLTFTRDFRRGPPETPLTQDGKLIRKMQGDDARLRVLATISGNWHTEWANDRLGLIPDPGDNFALCPNGLLIHDTQHDLLCFQPLLRSKIHEGRLLLSLPHQTDSESSCFHLPIGGRCWGRLSGHEMFFFSQSMLTGSLTQHRLCFGLRHQNGFPIIVPKPKKNLTRAESAPVYQTPPTPPELPRRADLVEEFTSLSINEDDFESG